MVTLTIPGFNDSEEELRRAAAFLASVSVDIPWHVTAFHHDYKMRDRGATHARRSSAPRRSARRRGCATCTRGTCRAGWGVGGHPLPPCRATLIERDGFRVLENRLAGGACPDCGTPDPRPLEPVGSRGPTRTHGIPLPVI